MVHRLGFASGACILQPRERARLREQGPRDTSPSILSDTEAGNLNVAEGGCDGKAGYSVWQRSTQARGNPGVWNPAIRRLDLEFGARLRVAAQLQPFVFESIQG